MRIMIEGKTRICTRCGIEKNVSEYYKRKIRGVWKVRSHCKICWNISSAKWNKLHPEKSAEYVRRHRKKHGEQTSIENSCKRNGITVIEYLETFRVQNGKCAICGVSHLELLYRLSCDHCHITNKFRGLLCSNCNAMLGMVHDNVSILKKAIDYLNFHRTKTHVGSI